MSISIEEMIKSPGFYQMAANPEGTAYYVVEVDQDGTVYQLTPAGNRDGVLAPDGWPPAARVIQKTTKPHFYGLMSINEAAAAGVDRLRKPEWRMREDHLKIDIIDGKPGPWTHLYSVTNLAFNKRDPVDILLLNPAFNMDYDLRCFVHYSGPLPESEEYRNAVANFTEGSHFG